MGSRGERSCIPGRGISKDPEERQRVESKGTERNLSRECIGKVSRGCRVADKAMLSFVFILREANI